MSVAIISPAPRRRKQNPARTAYRKFRQSAESMARPELHGRQTAFNALFLSFVFSQLRGENCRQDSKFR
jgi:hypothetical protein